jgi:hypothetical protein
MTKRALVVTAVCCLTCSPGYEDGKTRCSEQGTCPSGYICSESNSDPTHVCVTRPSSCSSRSTFYCRTSQTCWSSEVSCSTLVDCGSGKLGACHSSALRYDCNTDQCVSDSPGGGGGTGCTDPDYPVHCDSLGTVPAGCWGPGAVCSTVTNCGTASAADYHACASASYHYDCSGGKCTPNADGGTASCAAAPAAGGTCNVLPACGCPAGQVCYPYSQATGLTCGPTSGLGEGAACTSGSACAAGLGCFGGVCRVHCLSATDCRSVDGVQACESTSWDSDNLIAGVFVCSRVCDPVSPQSPRSPLAACPAAHGCGPSPTGASDCQSQPGVAVSGSACSTYQDCAPGYFCDTTGKTCFRFCYTAANCPSGTTCQPFSTPQYAGSVQVNYCAPPR